MVSAGVFWSVKTRIFISLILSKSRWNQKVTFSATTRKHTMAGKNILWRSNIWGARLLPGGKAPWPLVAGLVTLPRLSGTRITMTVFNKTVRHVTPYWYIYNQWCSKGSKWGHVPRGTGIGSASTHFLQSLKTRF